MAAAWIAAPKADRRVIAAAALAGAIPDVDLFLPLPHRGPLHSVAAAILIAGLAWIVLRLTRSPLDRSRTALAIGAAYASHAVLDWMGADSSTPRGLMLLWPWTSEYFISEVPVFRSISRRYWLESFWRDNLLAVVQELAILVPTAALVAWLRRARRSPGQYV